MSQNNSFVSDDFQYTQSSDVSTVQNVYVPEASVENILSLIINLNNEIASLITEVVDLKTEVVTLKKEVKELKEENKRSIIKLTEEVIAVKLENRKYHADNIMVDEFKDAQKFPFNNINDLNTFDALVQENEEKLTKFKEYIAKTGGDSAAQFLRAAVRKIFSDDLATMHSWKGTSTKPSAEKCFLITTIKNICHLKYKSTDKDMNVVLQKHFVHAKDRVTKKTKKTDKNDKEDKN